MKLISTFLKDLRLSFRSYYIYIEVIMALLIIAVLLFVVPENFAGGYKIAAHLEIDRDAVMLMAEQMGSSDSEMTELEQLLETVDAVNEGREATDSDDLFAELPGNIQLLGSREAVEVVLEDDRNSVGILLKIAGSGKPQLEFILQGFESQQMRNLLETQIAAPMLEMIPGVTDEAEITRLENVQQKLPDRINLLPVLLLMNSGFVGLFIIAAYIFMDKEEGTIRALAVTPVRISDYLLSKIGIMLLTGLVTGLLTVLAVAGEYVHYGHFLVLITAFNLFGSVLGLVIGSFYDSLTKSMGALYVVIVVLALASVSYFMPSFAPLAIRLLPSYPMLFALREVLTNEPDLAYVYTWSGVFVAAAMLLFWFAHWRYQKTITI